MDGSFFQYNRKALSPDIWEGREKMRKAISSLLGGAVLLILLSSPASAVLIYDNGPMDGNTTYCINYGSAISNSFYLSSALNLTQAQISISTQYGDDVPISANWSIGTDKFLSNIDSGTANLTNTLIHNYYGYGVYKSIFPLSLSLAPGTYWLTLQNAISINSGNNMNEPLHWITSNGPSQAYQSIGGSIISLENHLLLGSNSQSFQLYGTPEPGTMVLLGSGLAGLWVARRKKFLK